MIRKRLAEGVSLTANSLREGSRIATHARKFLSSGYSGTGPSTLRAVAATALLQ